MYKNIIIIAGGFWVMPSYQMLSKHLFPWSLQQHELVGIIIPILQMRKQSTEMLSSCPRVPQLVSRKLKFSLGT